MKLNYLSSSLIRCSLCNQLIKSKKDLITCFEGILEIKPYHNGCFSKKLKTRNAISDMMRNYPINGFSGNIRTIFFLVIFIAYMIYALFLYTDKFPWVILSDARFFLFVTISSLFFIGIRIYSYVMYEMDLK